jgi:hypothetical protein
MSCSDVGEKLVTSDDDAPSVHASGSLDALRRSLDELLASVPLAAIPNVASGQDSSHLAVESLAAQVEQLFAQRVGNRRELRHWLAESERAVRAKDDVRAMEALSRYAEHLRLVQEADAMLTEFRSLIADVLQSLQPVDRPT